MKLFRLKQSTVMSRPIGLRLPGKHMRQMGSGTSFGWPYALSALEEVLDPKGAILLDDAFERTFQDRWRQPPWKEPFVAIFHHPHNMPHWFNEKQTLATLFDSPWWKKCRKYMRGAIALSNYLATDLRERLDVPVGVVKLPSELSSPEQQFRWDDFCENPKPSVVQIGWYLRNYKGIHQLRAPAWLTRIHLYQRAPHIERAYRNTDEFSPWRHRPEYPGVEVLERVPDAEYNRLLKRNIVFLDLFDTSANNAIVECIVRNTPILVNNHPAVREYLGDDYPLCFDNINECYALLNDRSRLQAAHDCLAGMDKTDMKADAFREGVMNFVHSLSL
jgi:hypothetical protein